MNEENVNENVDVQNEIERVKKELEKITEKATKSGNKKLSGEQLLAKMFIPRETKEEYRPLPKGPGQKDIIITAYYHEILVNGQDGKPSWKKLYCPAYNEPFEPKLDADGNPVKDQNGKVVMKRKYCPICHKYHDKLKELDNTVDLRKIKAEELTPAQKAIADKNKEVFKKANQYKPRLFYIMRGIDKGKIKDGVKFWRFKDNYKKEGTYDKLIPVIKDFMVEKKAVYYNPENGCDLSVTTAKVLNKTNHREYIKVSAITCKQKPLTDDPILAKQWISDPISFKDVFGPRVSFPVIDYNRYLELVAEGNAPYWDKEDKNFVFPNHPEIEEEINQRKQSYIADNNDTDTPTRNVHANVVDIDNEINKLEKAKENSENATTSNNVAENTMEESSIDKEIDDLPF